MLGEGCPTQQGDCRILVPVIEPLWGLIEQSMVRFRFEFQVRWIPALVWGIETPIGNLTEL